jgi:MFS family permease
MHAHAVPTAPAETMPKQRTGYLIWAFLASWLGGVFDGMDSTLMGMVMPVAIGDLTGLTTPGDVARIGSWITAIFLIGWTLGGFVFGWVGDRWGRLKAMLLSILLYSAFTGLAGLSHSWEQLALCRFLTGLGIGGELVSIATYLSEIWPARSKSLAIGALITSYQAGVFLAGLIQHSVPGWREVFFAGALPALLVLVFRLTLKESDQWEAHASETQPGLLPTLKLHQRNLLLGGLAFTGLLVAYWASLGWIPAWIQSMVGGKAVEERSTATMFQGAAAIIGCLTGGWLSGLWGRRRSIQVASLLGIASSLVLFGCNQTFTPWVYGGNALLGFSTGWAQAALYVYLPELFPTAIRAMATGICLNMGRVLTAVAVLLAGSLVQWFGGYATACMVFACFYLITFGVLFLTPETKNNYNYSS